jgi:hypothetical protein
VLRARRQTSAVPVEQSGGPLQPICEARVKPQCTPPGPPPLEKSWTFEEKIALGVAMCLDRRLTHADCRVAIAMLFYFHNSTSGALYPSRRQVTQRWSARERQLRRERLIEPRQGARCVGSQGQRGGSQLGRAGEDESQADGHRVQVHVQSKGASRSLASRSSGRDGRRWSQCAPTP